uniref:Phosphomevalonate kinase n=1 Tax=Elaeophora elaphi TaxID=1147741 RepID=A0A0R3RZE5_9BILA
MKHVVVCLSGKRKCGKDFVGSLLANRLEGMGCKVIICGISYPLKEEYARQVFAKADSADVLIVTDCRRLSDIEFFKMHCGSRLRLLRIETSLAIREMRGFVFVKGIDDQITECGLDEYADWDVVFTNDIQTVDGTLPPNLDECLTRFCFEICQLLFNQK